MDITPLWLVVNAASGSNSDAAVDGVIAALHDAGLGPARTVRFPDEDLPTRETLEQAGVATLAVFTGDGTINTASTGIEGWGGTVLVLPGGTQNLLSKTLHGDVPPIDVIAAVAAGRGQKERLRVIRTSQGTSLVEVLAGPGAMWADVREGVRDLDLGAIAETFATAWRETTDGPGVRLADPAVGKDEGYRAVRIAPSGAQVLAEGYDFEDLGQFAAQGFAMLVKRDFRQGPHDDLGHFDRVTCHSDSPIALMIDGERRHGGTREDFVCEEFDLDFLTTKAGGD
ncbi:MAG: hypothetical protein RIS85_2172 [Pseudomonadota bacterium]